MKPEKKDGPGPGVAVGYDTLGYTFAFSILGFAGVGYLLDRWLGWLPLLTILGTLTGAGLAFGWVYLRVRAESSAAHHGETRRGEDGEA